MATDLIRFTQWARESPQRQYTALMGMLYDPEGLTASFERQLHRLAGHDVLVGQQGVKLPPADHRPQSELGLAVESLLGVVGLEGYIAW